MADLTRNAAPLRFRNSKYEMEIWGLDNSAAQNLYRAQPMILDKSADTTLARGWVSTTTLVSGTDVFLGILAAPANVLTTDVEVDKDAIIITRGEVGIKSAAFTDADVGKSASFTDSGTLAVGADAADEIRIGKINRVEDGYVYIDIEQHVITFS